MFDIAKDLLKQTPHYLNDVFNVVIAPRSHIHNTLDRGVEDAWTRSLSFILVSFILVFLLKWAIFPAGGDIKEVMVGEGVLEVFVVIVDLLILLLVWKGFFRAANTPQTLLVPYLFILGIAMLIDGFSSATQFAVTKVFDPDLWTLMEKMKSASNSTDLQSIAAEYGGTLISPADPSQRQVALNLLTIVQTVSSLVVLLWVIAAWIVYKDLTQKSLVAVYSALILVIALTLLNPAAFAKSIVLMAMNG